MRYIVKAVQLCPEGMITGINYWIAENEKHMKAMLKVGNDYLNITCLGPETELSYTQKNRLKITQQVNEHGRI